MISYIFVGFFLLLIRHFSRRCDKAQSSLCIAAHCFSARLWLGFAPHKVSGWQLNPPDTRIGDSLSTSNILIIQMNLSALPVLCPKKKRIKIEYTHAIECRHSRAKTPSTRYSLAHGGDTRQIGPIQEISTLSDTAWLGVAQRRAGGVLNPQEHQSEKKSCLDY